MCNYTGIRVVFSSCIPDALCAGPVFFVELFLTRRWIQHYACLEAIAIHEQEHVTFVPSFDTVLAARVDFMLENTVCSEGHVNRVLLRPSIMKCGLSFAGECPEAWMV